MCDVIIDTGASLSLISKDFYNSLLFKSTIVREPFSRRLKSATGGPIRTLGRTEIYLTIGSTKYKIYLLVCDGVESKVILGNDFLHHWGFTIDYNRGYLWNDRNTMYKFNIGDNNNTSINQILISATDYVIPPNHTAFIQSIPRRHPKGRFSLLNKSVLIESLDQDNCEYTIPRSIMDSSYTIGVPISNPHSFPININKFDPIASAYYFDSDSINIINNNTNHINLNNKNNNENQAIDIGEIDVGKNLSKEEELKIKNLITQFKDLFTNEISIFTHSIDRTHY